MKIKLDFDNKIVTLDESVNLKEFISMIKSIIPNWKDWKLDTNTTITWNNPITVPYVPYTPYREWWTDYPTIRYDTTLVECITTNVSTSFDTITGSYCIDIDK